MNGCAMPDTSGLHKIELSYALTARDGGSTGLRNALNAGDDSANYLRGRMLVVTHLFTEVEQVVELHFAIGTQSFEWKLNGRLSHALISLECSEAKLYGPSSELHCDLKPEVTEQLKQLLKSYQNKRPAAESSQ